MKRLLPILLATSLLGGCATVTLTRAEGRTTVDIQNTCWYPFCIFPIGSGDPDAPNVKCCVWFRDKADVENNMKMLRDLCEREHAHAINVQTKYDDEKISFVLLKRLACNTTAELIKD